MRWCWMLLPLAGCPRYVLDGLEPRDTAATLTDAAVLPDRAADIALGPTFSCTRTSQRAIWCWGADLVPRGWRGVSDARALAVGADAFGGGAALIARDFGEGTVWTLLGSGSAIATDWPAEVTRVSIGRGHQCVLSPGSGVRSILACWGENGRGQAGQPVDAEAPTVDAPAAVAQAITALDVVAFGRSTCVLDEDHRVWCAGANFGDSHVWRAVPALDGLRTLSGAATAPDEADAEAFELCGLDGAAPAGIACSSLTFEGDGFRQVSVAAGYACAVTEDFGVTCVGDARAAAPTDLPQVLEVAVTDDRACAISVDGDIWCWGGAPWSTEATILPLQPPPTDAD